MNRSDLDYDGEHGDATVRLRPPLFGHEVVVQFFPDLDGDGEVTDRMLAAATDVERLGPEHRSALAALLYAHAERCFESTDYGHDTRPGEGVTEANRRAFGVRTVEDALREAGRPEYVQVSEEDDSRAARFAVLVYYPPWEDEHGCGVVLRDGVPVGWGPASVYVGEFDEGEA